MPETWTARLVGELHLHKLTARRLAKEVGWSEKYLSAVLNGHRTPKRAQEKLDAALERLIHRQEECNKNEVQ